MFGKLKMDDSFLAFYHINCIAVYKAINHLTPSSMNDLFNIRNCTSYSLRPNENNHIELDFPRIEYKNLLSICGMAEG